MSTSPRFSVVIPTYNRGHLIGRAVAGVLAQTVTDLELIVVDDGSEDDTPAVLARTADPRLRVVTQLNRGRSAARNAGAAVARGEYLAFADSDDEVLPQWLAAFEEGLQQTDRVGIACAGLLRKERARADREVMPHPLGLLYGTSIDVRGLFRAQSFVVRRELFEQVGGYVEQLAFSENTELALRLVPAALEAGWRIVSVDRTEAVYHVDRPERQSIKTRQEMLFASEYMLTRHRTALERVPRVHALFHGIAGVRAARIGNITEARRHCARAVRIYPWNYRHWFRMIAMSVPPITCRIWAIDVPTAGASAAPTEADVERP